MLDSLNGFGCISGASSPRTTHCSQLRGRDTSRARQGQEGWACCNTGKPPEGSRAGEYWRPARLRLPHKQRWESVFAASETTPRACGRRRARCKQLWLTFLTSPRRSNYPFGFLFTEKKHAASLFCKAAPGGQFDANMDFRR